MLREVVQGEEALGPKISKDEFTNGVVDLVKSSRRSDMKACHVIDQMNTNEEVDQTDEAQHRLQG
jgi:hypothetical protein